MADIKPFKGVVYNNEKIPDLKSVTTPPYDVIAKAEQEAFYEISEHNIIRLVLGKKTDVDDLSDNRYTRARAFLDAWFADGTLIRDEKESIYVYQQDYYLADGTKKTRTGFIALIRLEDFSSGKILPHEKTLSGPRSDRMKLMESCHCNFSQIFSIYSDKELKVDEIIAGSIAGRQPDMDVTDNMEITHRIYRVTDLETISIVASLMKEKSLFIADGHHRYETALAFRDSNSKTGDLPADNPYNYVMMYCANMDNDGLVVFPTHRVLFNLPDSKIDFLKSEISKYFTVTDFSFTGETESDALEKLVKCLEKEGETKHAFGMYCKGDERCHLLVLDDMSKVEEIIGTDIDESLKNLDVTVLHSVLIDHLLGVGTAAQEKQENLKYVKGSDNAFKLVKEGGYQVTFILNPTKVEQVRDVASSGNKMPQKSTFFYPKLLTGLVINCLNSK